MVQFWEAANDGYAVSMTAAEVREWQRTHENNTWSKARSWEENLRLAETCTDPLLESK